ncbi:MAG: DUF3293 domain-containing protein [Pseudomonadota bacterium]
MNDALQDAFSRTIYRVFLPEREIDLRVGEHSPALERSFGGAMWIVFSPGNPGAKALSASDNARRMADLKAWLGRHHLRHYDAVGLPTPDQDWAAEASLLILDVTDAQARELAARYDQLAWLAGGGGQPSRLVWSSGV